MVFVVLMIGFGGPGVCGFVIVWWVGCVWICCCVCFSLIVCLIAGVVVAGVRCDFLCCVVSGLSCCGFCL